MSQHHDRRRTAIRERDIQHRRTRPDRPVSPPHDRRIRRHPRPTATHPHRRRRVVQPIRPVRVCERRRHLVPSAHDLDRYPGRRSLCRLGDRRPGSPRRRRRRRHVGGGNTPGAHNSHRDRAHEHTKNQTPNHGPPATSPVPLWPGAREPRASPTSLTTLPATRLNRTHSKHPYKPVKTAPTKPSPQKPPGVVSAASGTGSPGRRTSHSDSQPSRLHQVDRVTS